MKIAGVLLWLTGLWRFVSAAAMETAREGTYNIGLIAGRAESFSSAWALLIMGTLLFSSGRLIEEIQRKK